MIRLALITLILCFSFISLSAQSDTAAQNCIAIMGDSLPAGTFVAQVPGTGVTVLQSREVSQILDDALQARDMLHYGIYDLSLAASAIADPDAEAYLTSREYFLGRELNCRYTVIFPFLNDLYSADNGSTGVAIYQQALSTMIAGIRTNSPDSHIVVMNFYHTILQGLGNETYGDDVTRAHVISMNTVHETLCDADALSYCLPIDEIFAPINDFVVSRISRSDYETFRYTLVNPDDQAMLDGYWANNPSGAIFGDGLHFNPDGQVRIVATLMSVFAQIDPINFAPILQ